MNDYIIHKDGELQHYGVKGTHWGVRRYQNKDGSYKPGAEGRYYTPVVGSINKSKLRDMMLKKPGSATDKQNKSGNSTRDKVSKIDRISSKISGRTKDTDKQGARDKSSEKPIDKTVTGKDIDVRPVSEKKDTTKDKDKNKEKSSSKKSSSSSASQKEKASNEKKEKESKFDLSDFSNKLNEIFDIDNMTEEDWANLELSDDEINEIDEMISQYREWRSSNSSNSRKVKKIDSFIERYQSWKSSRGNSANKENLNSDEDLKGKDGGGKNYWKKQDLKYSKRPTTEPDKDNEKERKRAEKEEAKKIKEREREENQKKKAAEKERKTAEREAKQRQREIEKNDREAQKQAKQREREENQRLKEQEREEKQRQKERDKYQKLQEKIRKQHEKEAEKDRKYYAKLAEKEKKKKAQHSAIYRIHRKTNPNENNSYIMHSKERDKQEMRALYLKHHGILGMHWGIRRYQNPDGTLTEAGKKRYSKLLDNAKTAENKFNTKPNAKNFTKAMKENSKFVSYIDKTTDFSKNYEKLNKLYQKKFDNANSRLFGREKLTKKVVNEWMREADNLMNTSIDKLGFGDENSYEINQARAYISNMLMTSVKGK